MFKKEDIFLGTILYISVVFFETSALQYGFVNQTRRGICSLEVPTIELLSPEARRGVIPQGNGTKHGYSKIDICCSGWVRKQHSHFGCEPVCENGCENGNCTAPNVCECRRGFVKIGNNICIPTCPLGCLNGVCTINGQCSCNAGYVASRDGRYCTPHCTGGCGVGGECTGAETCTCAKGFALNRDTNKCGYFCEGGCGGGTCIGPNQCSCKPGYKIEGNSCTPDCPRGCLNGECTAPNRCTCKPGWNLDKVSGSVCTPHCSQTCLNVDCVGPETCACKRGYVPAGSFGNGIKCVASCPEGCPNGICTAPNFCICNPGYVKMAKGSNVCVRRLKRSFINLDLIPEKLFS